MAITQIAKWGNSLGVRIPKSVLEDARLQNNDEVSISYVNDSIIIKKTSPEVTIKELFADFDKSLHFEEEIDFGEDVGEEKW